MKQNLLPEYRRPYKDHRSGRSSEDSRRRGKQRLKWTNVTEWTGRTSAERNDWHTVAGKSWFLNSTAPQRSFPRSGEVNGEQLAVSEMCARCHDMAVSEMCARCHDMAVSEMCPRLSRYGGERNVSQVVTIWRWLTVVACFSYFSEFFDMTGQN